MKFDPRLELELLGDMSDFYQLELNLIFQVCAKNSLEKALLFNLMTLSPGAVSSLPLPSAREHGGMLMERVLWNNVLLVVCSVLKVFEKVSWKMKRSFSGLPLL